MNNITYDIKDKTYNELSDISSCESNESIMYDISHIDSESESELVLKKCKYSNIDEHENQINENMAKTIDYDLNYSIKYLGNILEFYEIKKHRLNKKEIIKKIIEYENNENNKIIVAKRYRLFANFIELKNDTFFSRYIMGGL